MVTIHARVTMTEHRDTRRSIYDTLSYWSLLLLGGLLPLVFVPSASAPFLLTKAYVGVALVFITLGFYSIGRLQSQAITAPRALGLLAVWLVPVAYGVSALLTGGAVSFFGERIGIDTVGFMLVGALALTLGALILTTKERLLSMYLVFLGSALLLTVLQLGVFFGRETLGALGLYFPSLSLVGSLNDLGAFFGLIVLLVLVTLSQLTLASRVRVGLWVLLVVSAFFLMVVNLTALWWIVGTVALATFVYNLYASMLRNSKGASFESLSLASLGVVALSAFFLFGSTAVTGALAQYVNVGELDVRPSWTTTIGIGGKVYQESAIVGAGPGSFQNLWSKHRPADIDQTDFWNADFSFGIGLLPTSFITTGVVGAIAWLVFLGVLLFTGVRALVFEAASQDPIVAYLQASSFLAAAYLWVLNIVQVPSPTLILFAFLTSGFFVASVALGARKYVVFSFKERPKLGFLATLVSTLALLGAVSGLYSSTVRYTADTFFQRAVLASEGAGDLDAAERLVENALTLSPTDSYYRFATSLGLVRLQRLLAENKPPEEIRERFQGILGTAVANARTASELDPNDYQNWLALGNIYQSVVPLGIEGAAPSARTAMERALEHRPNAPNILLSLAALERSQGNAEAARTYVERAISARNRYTDAIFFLAQLQIEANDVENATRSVEAATVFEPQNPVAYFQLGILRYGAADYQGAATALERAVALNNVYANARYFLGLAYFQLNRRDDAIAQFEQVLSTNPESSEVQTILANLRAGRPPLEAIAGAAPIENRDGPPLTEAGEADPVEE